MALAAVTGSSTTSPATSVSLLLAGIKSSKHMVESNLNAADISAEHGEAPPAKKQKRNKPTLSCQYCSEKKIKVGMATLAAARGEPWTGLGHDVTV